MAASNKGRKDFTNFLLKAISMYLVIGIAVALSVFAGYKIGANLDIRYSFFPTFTLIGIFSGIGAGSLTGFFIIQKYMKTPATNKIDPQNYISSKKEEQELKQYPIIDVTIDQVRKAVREYSNHLPKGVYRTILVKEDNSIDFSQLTHLLNGIPSQKYYMSKETYDIFEESEKKIPVEMDLVQKAVDQFVKDHKQYPMLQFDPQHRVNYYQLIQKHYLKAPPEIQFYITDLDGLITHVKPGKKLDRG